MANPTQIHQVIINLCTNAYHAMREHGGILRISLVPYTVETSENPALKNLPQGLLKNQQQVILNLLPGAMNVSSW